MLQHVMSYRKVAEEVDKEHSCNAVASELVQRDDTIRLVHYEKISLANCLARKKSWKIRRSIQSATLWRRRHCCGLRPQYFRKTVQKY